MPVQASDLKWYLPANSGDGPTCGGAPAAQLASGVKNNLFPDVAQSERAAGSVRTRVLYAVNEAADDSALMNAYAYLSSRTAAGDYALISPLDNGRMVGDFDAAADGYYGIAQAAGANAGASSITVTCESDAHIATYNPFRPGLAIIQEGASTEIITVTATSSAGAQLTLALAGTLSRAYSSAATVSSLCPLRGPKRDQVIRAGLESWSQASVSGGCDPGKIEFHNAACPQETWTITFVSATGYNLTSVHGYGPYTGTTGSDLIVNNLGTGRKMMTLRAAMWGGGYQAGDSVTLNTGASAAGLIVTRVVPAGCPPLVSNSIDITLEGETA